MLGGITNSLAGKGPVKYTTDTAGRTVADPNQPQESMGNKWRRIGAAALTGLGAGAQAGGQKSGLANALSGVGAGAEAQTKKTAEQDKLAREQEKQNAEAAEQKKVRMAQTARENALTYTTWKHMIDEDIDRNPEYKNNNDIVTAAKDSDMGIKYVSDSELNKMDPKFVAEHSALPVGMQEVKGPDGQPLTDENQKPKMEPRFALIDGFHNGNVAVPASFVADIQKYGKYADGGGTSGEDSLKAGDEISADHFKMLRTSILEGKKKVLEGWAKPTLSWTGPDQDKPVLVNSNTGDVKAFSSDPKAVPNAANKPESAEKKNELTDSQIALNKDKGLEALNNAALAAQALGGAGTPNKEGIPAYIDAISQLPATSQAILRAVRPDDQLALLAVATGDADVSKTFPTRTTAKSGQMDAAKATGLVKLLNPEWNTQYYKAVQEATDDMVKGPDHKALLSFNQFLSHADDARQGSIALARTNSPWLNRPINEIRNKGLGDPAVNKLLTDIMAARTEWNTFIHANHVPTKEDTDAGRVLLDDSSNPAQIMGVFGEMGKQAVGRLDPINEGYKTVTHRDWPNLITPEGRKAAMNLGLGDQIAKYKTGGTLRGAMNAGSSVTEQPKTSFAPGTHTFDSKAWAANNPGKDVSAAIAKAKAQGFEVK